VASLAAGSTIRATIMARISLARRSGLRSDNQDENRATIRMRMCRPWDYEGRA
jgi:hypothetical protein